MKLYYRDYIWKRGIPYGIGGTTTLPLTQAYTIFIDPYRKRISIERYLEGRFVNMVYDSQLLDFRSLLPPADQSGWQREVVATSTNETSWLIRNQEERLVFRETILYKGELPRECRVFSLYGIPLSIHKIFYTNLGDPFNGAILYDMHEHPVMKKSYECNEKGEFTNLLEEYWDMEAIQRKGAKVQRRKGEV